MLDILKNMFNKFKIDFLLLIKSGFSDIFISNAFTNMLLFFGGMILVRVLDKGEYGVYSYANTIYSFIFLMSGMGIVSGAFQLCCENSQDKVEQKAIYDYSCKIGVIINCGIAVIIGIVSKFVPLAINGANKLLGMMILMPILAIIYDFISVYFRFELLNKKYAMLNMIYASIYFLSTVIGALIFQTGGMIIANYISYLLSVLVGIKFLGARFLFNKSNNFLSKRGLLFKISLVSFANNALSKIMYLIDVFALGIVLKNESIIASYKIATVIPTALLFLPSTICLYVYPYFATNKKKYDWNKIHFLKLLCAIVPLNAILSSILFLFARVIITLVFGQQYMDCLIPFRILVISFFFNASFRIIVGNLLVAQRKLKFNFCETLISGVVNIIGDVLLIPSMGSTGAALSTLMVTVFSSLLCMSYYGFNLHCLKDKTIEVEVK